jgi:O-antigen/teichoic acid export membrane protein
MSFKKNFLKNGIATAFQKGIKISEQLLLVPFFITAWGAAYYGEWLTLTIIPTIMGLSDLGFGTAAANSFILKYSSGDKQSAANIAASGFRTINIMATASVAISVFIMLILSYYHVLDKTLINKNDAIIAISFLMAARIIGFYQQLYEAYFRAARKASLSINLLSIYSVLNLVVGLLVLILGGGIVQFAVANFSIAVVFIIFYALMARRTLPLRKEFIGKVNNSDIKVIMHKGFGFLLSPVWQAIFFQGTTFVVRVVLGPVAVTIFNTVRTATRAINQANGMVISSVLPELQFEIGANNFQKARKIFRFSLTIVLLISIVGMVFLYFGGPWLYEIWTNKVLKPPAMMWNFFILGIGFNGIWWMSSDVLIASNKPYDFVFAAIICSLLAVLISYFMTIYYGLTGAAVGSLLLDIALAFYVLPRSCKLINQPVRTFIADSIADLHRLKIGQIEFITKRKIK